VFFVRFAVIFTALMGLYLVSTPYVSRFIIHRLNAGTASRIINLCTPGERTVARRDAITAPGISLSIAKGCEGIETMILVIAALAAYFMPARRKLEGIAAGIALIYVVNLVRIISLYYIFRYRPAWFDFAHLYFWQVVIIFIGVAFFLFWIERFGQSTPPADR